MEEDNPHQRISAKRNWINRMGSPPNSAPCSLSSLAKVFLGMLCGPKQKQLEQINMIDLPESTLQKIGFKELSLIPRQKAIAFLGVGQSLEMLNISSSGGVILLVPAWREHG